MFTPGGWTELGNPSSSSSSSQNSYNLKEEEIRKIEGRAGIRTQEFIGEAAKYLLNCSVYNGTSNSLTDLTIKFEIKETDTQKSISREYKLHPKNGGVIPPLSNGDFEADIGLNPASAK